MSSARTIIASVATIGLHGLRGACKNVQLLCKKIKWQLTPVEWTPTSCTLSPNANDFRTKKQVNIPNPFIVDPRELNRNKNGFRVHFRAGNHCQETHVPAPLSFSPDHFTNPLKPPCLIFPECAQIESSRFSRFSWSLQRVFRNEIICAPTIKQRTRKHDSVMKSIWTGRTVHCDNHDAARVQFITQHYLINHKSWNRNHDDVRPAA